MPVKFRCQHCRQFLGISRSKAGQIVDCPTCGRTIRVPHLDGRVEPLPAPSLNYEDDSLVDALDALAKIGDEEPVKIEESVLPVSDDSPVPLSEPIARSAPAPVAVADPMPKVDPIAVEPTGTGTGPATNPLADLGNAAQPAHVPRTGAGGSSKAAYVLAGVLGLALIVVVGLGQFRGNGADSPSEADPAQPGGDDGDEPANRVVIEGTALSGAIVYKSETGDSPDTGARVLAFPAERTGSVRVPVIGFRPGDDEADFKVARASLAALGGNAAIVDEDGRYTMTLPAAGTYRVLVLSRYRARDVDEPAPPGLDSLLAEYFDRPAQLLGERRFELGEVRYRGTDPVAWSFTFPDERH